MKYSHKVISYGSESSNISEDLSPHFLGYIIEVEDEAREDLLVMTLPLSDVLQVLLVVFRSFCCSLGYSRIASGLEFPLKGSRLSITSSPEQRMAPCLSFFRLDYLSLCWWLAIRELALINCL